MTVISVTAGQAHSSAGNSSTISRDTRTGNKIMNKPIETSTLLAYMMFLPFMAINESNSSHINKAGKAIGRYLIEV